MLTEVTRQSINGVIQINEGPHASVFFGQSGLLDLRFQIERVRKVAVSEEMGEAVNDTERKVERFSDLTGGTSPAISNDVSGHGGTVPAVTAINFLDYAFPPIAAGQIEINVRPAFAAFAQEAFKDEVITDRIDRGNAETITDRAVGGAAASLHHDVVFATKIDDVPDN